MKTFPHHYSSTTSLDCWHRALWCWCEFLTLPSASLCRLCFSVLRFLVSLCQLPLHISIYVRSRCCSSPASRLDVCELWDPFCAHNSHKDLLSELPQPFCQLQPVWPFSFDLSSTRHFLQQNYCSLDVTFFLSWFHTFHTILSKDCCTWKSKERNSTPVHLVSTISLSSKSSMFSLSLFLMFPVNINWDSLCTSLLPHDWLTG